MLQSMTGFGKAVKETPDAKIIVEIKTLNSKNTNIILHISDVFREKENDLRNKIAAQLERGKIDVYIKSEKSDSDRKIKLNKSVIENYYKELSEIANAKNHSVHDEQIFQIIMRLPEVFSGAEEIFSEAEWKLIDETCDKAIKEVVRFRKQEGLAVQNDIVGRLSTIENLIPLIEPFEIERTAGFREKLRKKIEEIDNEKPIDRDRLEQEIIFYLEKSDTSEEKTRLINHCAYFRQTLTDSEAPGRKLGFITQEIGREINTLGSKAAHYEIQKIVVMMKDELEKIKEQILNIL